MEDSIGITPKTYNDIGLIMSTHYEIIALCLQNLSNIDLLSVATVCKSWYHVTQSELKKRTKLRCMFLKTDKCPRKLFKEQLQVFIGRLAKLMAPVSGTHVSFCIAFATSRVQTNKKDDAFYVALRKTLPPSCDTILAYSNGIMGFNSDIDGKDNAIEVIHVSPSPGFAAIAIPKLPGITTHFFKTDIIPSYPGYNLKILKNEKYYDMTNLNKEMLCGPVRCALFFCENMFIREVNLSQKLYKLIKESQAEDFSYGGCVVTSTWAPNTQSCSFGTGILFCGDNLQTASVIIGESDSEEESIQQRICELKSCNFHLKNSMAFMFSCVGRADLIAETEIFQRHFPNTPLIGLVGNGEIGLNFLPGEQKGFQPKRRAAVVDHYYSSCIVLLSWDSS